MRTTPFVLLAATLLLRAASCQTEFRLRLAPGPATGEPRLALHTDLDAATAAQQLDAVLPSPGQAATGAPFVAANLFDTVARARAGVASVVLTAAGTRILVTGIVDPARAGAGRVADDPAVKLREVLAGSDAHVVVVLTDLDRRAALQLLRGVPQATLVLQRAGALADRTPAEVDGRFVVPWPDDRATRRFVAALQDGKLKAPHFELLPPDPAQAMALLRQLLHGAAAPKPDVVTARIVRSRAVELHVHDVRFADSYGDRIGPCLVVDAEFANVMPLQFVYDRKIPVAWRVPRLQDHVYLVVGGTRLLQLSPDAAALPGHLPAPEFKLERLGERQRGNLVFPLPVGLRPGADTAMDLRVYDFAHGHLMLQLNGASPAAATPLSPLQQNEVVELGVYGVERRSELGGSTAPAGMTFVVVDVRARSTFRVDADATAFDPKAKAGQRLQVGTVADWTDSRRYLQLVADGAFGFPPVNVDFADALPPAPRFLPDLPTGGLVAFLVPAAAVSLQLRCDFPNAKSSIDGRRMRPKGFSVAIAGEPPALVELPVLASVKDSQFDVRVTRQEAAAAFGGVTAGQDQRFLLCDLEIRNVGKDGEFFQTKMQLQLATADGKLHELDPVAARGPAPALELLWVPPSELRRCTAVYRIAAADDRLRLRYASVDTGGAHTMELPPLAAAAAAAAATPAGKPAGKPAATTPPPPPGAPARPEGAPAAGAASHERERAATPPAATTEHPIPKGLAGFGLSAERVNAAIDRGASWLEQRVLRDDAARRVAFGDDPVHGLAAVALLHAGAHTRSPALAAAIRHWLETARLEAMTVYQLALVCLAVEALGDATLEPRLRAAARVLFEAQGPQGTWTYAPPAAARALANPPVTGALRVVAGPTAADDEAWARTVAATENGDNSLTQFALLGLNAAARSGVRIPSATWELARDATLQRQCPDGGFGYTTATTGYGSMTCAGACSLAICLHHLGVPDPAAHPAVQRAVAWLDAHVTVPANPRLDDWDFYYLYSVERVGRLLDTEFVGRHEWYPLGARWLVDAQGVDGAWTGLHGHEKVDARLSTSFALLFLTRATAALAPPPAAGPAVLATRFVPADGLRLYLVLDASGSMLDEMAGKTKFEAARDAVAALVEGLGRAEVALRVYGHRKRAIEPGADEDTVLEVPLRALDRPAFLAKLASLRARGKTPIAKSLADALRDLGRVDEKRPVTLVLLTDGGDDTTGRRDLEAVAARVGENNGVRLRVVGFDLKRPEWRQQLQAVASAGKGLYFAAGEAVALRNELRAAVLAEPRGFRVLDGAAQDVAHGALGEKVELPPGRYQVVVELAGVEHRVPIVLRAGRTTAVVFDGGKVGG